MNRFVTSLLALAAFALLAAPPVLAQDAPKPIALGASIPSDKVAMKNVDGKMLTIDSVKGAPTSRPGRSGSPSWGTRSPSRGSV